MYADGYNDARTRQPYNPTSQEYKDGWEDFLHESKAFERMSLPQLQAYILDKQTTEAFDADYENAQRIYIGRTE